MWHAATEVVYPASTCTCSPGGSGVQPHRALQLAIHNKPDELLLFMHTHTHTSIQAHTHTHSLTHTHTHTHTLTHTLTHAHYTQGTDEVTIISVLNKRSNAHRQEIRKKFQALYSKV